MSELRAAIDRVSVGASFLIALAHREGIDVSEFEKDLRTILGAVRTVASASIEPEN